MIHSASDPLFQFISFARQENIATAIQYSECYIVPCMYALFMGDNRSIAYDAFFYEVLAQSSLWAVYMDIGH